jgi:outer membrane immunogenic protein
MDVLKTLMKTVALVTTAASLIVTPANAGDSNKWGGLYIGANVGWIGKDFGWTFDPSIAPFQDSYTISQDDGIAGGHVGIQTQRGRFVLGVEMAYSGTGSVLGGDWAKASIPAAGAVNPLTDIAVKLGPVFTVGPRLGYAMNDNWLLFVGGGYANASIRSTLIDQPTGAHFFEASERHDGWYIGGGVEIAIRDNVIAGLEYQRLSFDEKYHCDLPCRLRLAGYRHVDADADVIRARLSFKLGRPEAPKESLK